MAKDIKCPICGQYDFGEIDTYDICPICSWENNEEQLKNLDSTCPNGLTFVKYKEKWDLFERIMPDLIKKYNIKLGKGFWKYDNLKVKSKYLEKLSEELTINGICFEKKFYGCFTKRKITILFNKREENGK